MIFYHYFNNKLNEYELKKYNEIISNIDCNIIFDQNYFITFPKNPNESEFKSNLHAIFMKLEDKIFIDKILNELQVNFPNVFKLYYSDGFYGKNIDKNKSDNILYL